MKTIDEREMQKKPTKQTAKKIQAKAESSIKKRSYNERVRAKWIVLHLN